MVSNQQAPLGCGVMLVAAIIMGFMFFPLGETTGGILWCIGLVIVWVVLVKWLNKRDEKQQELHTQAINAKYDEIDRLLESAGYRATKKCLDADKVKAVALIDGDQSICLVDGETVRAFPSRDILSVEVIEDGVTVTSTSRSNQIGGAVVGGLLAGGVGAVVGGLSAKTQTTSKIREVNLVVTVNDTTSPVFKMQLLRWPDGVDKGSPLYNQVIAIGQEWHGVIQVLIKRAESQANHAQPSNSGFVADELKKLAELLQTGVISEEEFQSQKAKLLS